MQKTGNQISFREYAAVEIVSGECAHSFPVHIHENLCIGLITSSYAEFMINGGKKKLLAGDYYVIPPYSAHSLAAIGSKKFSYTVLCFKDFCAQNNFSNIVVNAKTYIENVSESFSIDELSKAMCISKYHLIKIFGAQVGITPYQFYINSRVKKIRQGLQINSPLSDLVFDLGFTDQSHLCNIFKKHMGISPLQYACSYSYV